MGFKDFLKRGTGLDLVSDDQMGNNQVKLGSNAKQKKVNSGFDNNGRLKVDDKTLRKLEVEVSKAIERLEDVRDKLRVRRGY